jgi:hypothetical protein
MAWEGWIMPDKGTEYTLAILAGIGVVTLLYLASQMTGEQPVAEVQTDERVMGLGVQAGMRVNAGTPLDLSYHIHGWHPGYDPDPTGQPVTQSKHRYPAIPGGNLSTVMHQGWSQAMKNAPAGKDWFETPPEAAIV